MSLFPWVPSTRSAPSHARAAGWVLACGIVMVLASGCLTTGSIMLLVAPVEELRKAGFDDAQLARLDLVRAVLPFMMAAVVGLGLLPGLIYILSFPAVRRGRVALWGWLPWVLLGHALLLALLGTLHVLAGLTQGLLGAVLFIAVFYGTLLFLLGHTYAALRQTSAVISQQTQALEYPDLLEPGELTSDPWEHR